MEQSSCQEILCPFWNPVLHDRLHKTPDTKHRPGPDESSSHHHTVFISHLSHAHYMVRPSCLL